VSPSTKRPFLPSRLLDLSDVEISGKVKLAESNDICHTSQYVTLSHCWGALVLTRYTDETEEELWAGKAFEDLPKTFQDAMIVAIWANGERNLYSHT
jgi:hypothetical protein